MEKLMLVYAQKTRDAGDIIAGYKLALMWARQGFNVHLKIELEKKEINTVGEKSLKLPDFVPIHNKNST